MARPRKDSSEKPAGRPRKARDFTALMKDSFSIAQFNSIVSRSGIPTQDVRDLCDAFRKLKG
jgi:hypothetical protein